MKRLALICLTCGAIGCNPVSPNAPPPAAAPITKLAAPQEIQQAQRFVPTGSDPQVALDTQKGTLCRTIPASAGASDKYADLPLCTGEATAPRPVRFAWKEALSQAPLAVSCNVRKGLIPFYSVGDVATKNIIAPCLIQNQTDRTVTLDSSADYDAIMRGSNGKMTRRMHAGITSKEPTIPAHGHIEGGLSTQSKCDARQTDAECLKAWLGGTGELMLFSDSAGARAHVLMNREAGPLGGGFL